MDREIVIQELNFLYDKIERYENGEAEKRAKEYEAMWRVASDQVTKQAKTIEDAYGRIAQQGLRIGELLNQIDQLKGVTK